MTAPNPENRQTFDQGSVSWTPLGESAVVVDFGEQIDREILTRVWALTRHLEQFPIRGMIECVSAYTTVTIYFDPLAVSLEDVGHDVMRVVAQLDFRANTEGRKIEIPVCYDEEFGPDLEYVARLHGMTVPEVIDCHARGEYVVYLIGFAPGFPYLGGMSPRIATPRLDSPRLTVPPGSVGIAGEQTGIYSIATPGGWRLIGRTPVALFRPGNNPPCLLSSGDKVRIRQITRDEFHAWPEDRECPST